MDERAIADIILRIRHNRQLITIALNIFTTKYFDIHDEYCLEFQQFKLLSYKINQLEYPDFEHYGHPGSMASIAQHCRDCIDSLRDICSFNNIDEKEILDEVVPLLKDIRNIMSPPPPIV
jgi:hypothetical protein